MAQSLQQSARLNDAAAGMQVLQAVATNPKAASELLQRLDLERERHAQELLRLSSSGLDHATRARLEEEIARLAAEKQALAKYLTGVYGASASLRHPPALGSSLSSDPGGVFGGEGSGTGGAGHLLHHAVGQGGGSSATRGGAGILRTAVSVEPTSGRASFASSGQLYPSSSSFSSTAPALAQAGAAASNGTVREHGKGPGAMPVPVAGMPAFGAAAPAAPPQQPESSVRRGSTIAASVSSRPGAGLPENGYSLPSSLPASLAPSVSGTPTRAHRTGPGAGGQTRTSRAASVSASPEPRRDSVGRRTSVESGLAAGHSHPGHAHTHATVAPAPASTGAAYMGAGGPAGATPVWAGSLMAAVSRLEARLDRLEVQGPGAAASMGEGGAGVARTVLHPGQGAVQLPPSDSLPSTPARRSLHGTDHARVAPGAAAHGGGVGAGRGGSLDATAVVEQLWARLQAQHETLVSSLADRVDSSVNAALANATAAIAGAITSNLSAAVTETVAGRLEAAMKGVMTEAVREAASELRAGPGTDDALRALVGEVASLRTRVDAAAAAIPTAPLAATVSSMERALTGPVLERVEAIETALVDIKEQQLQQTGAAAAVGAAVAQVPSALASELSSIRSSLDAVRLAQADTMPTLQSVLAAQGQVMQENRAALAATQASLTSSAAAAAANDKHALATELLASLQQPLSAITGLANTAAAASSELLARTTSNANALASMQGAVDRTSASIGGVEALVRQVLTRVQEVGGEKGRLAALGTDVADVSTTTANMAGELQALSKTVDELGTILRQVAADQDDLLPLRQQGQDVLEAVQDSKAAGQALLQAVQAGEAASTAAAAQAAAHAAEVQAQLAHLVARLDTTADGASLQQVLEAATATAAGVQHLQHTVSAHLPALQAVVERTLSATSSVVAEVRGIGAVVQPQYALVQGMVATLASTEQAAAVGVRLADEGLKASLEAAQAAAAAGEASRVAAAAAGEAVAAARAADATAGRGVDSIQAVVAAQQQSLTAILSEVQAAAGEDGSAEARTQLDAISQRLQDMAVAQAALEQAASSHSSALASLPAALSTAVAGHVQSQYAAVEGRLGSLSASVRAEEVLSAVAKVNADLTTLQAQLKQEQEAVSASIAASTAAAADRATAMTSSIQALQTVLQSVSAAVAGLHPATAEQVGQATAAVTSALSALLQAQGDKVAGVEGAITALVQQRGEAVLKGVAEAQQAVGAVTPAVTAVVKEVQEQLLAHTKEQQKEVLAAVAAAGEGLGAGARDDGAAGQQLAELATSITVLREQVAAALAAPAAAPLSSTQLHEELQAVQAALEARLSTLAEDVVKPSTAKMEERLTAVQEDVALLRQLKSMVQDLSSALVGEPQAAVTAALVSLSDKLSSVGGSVERTAGAVMEQLRPELQALTAALPKAEGGAGQHAEGEQLQGLAATLATVAQQVQQLSQQAGAGAAVDAVEALRKAEEEATAALQDKLAALEGQVKEHSATLQTAVAGAASSTTAAVSELRAALGPDVASAARASKEAAEQLRSLADMPTSLSRLDGHLQALRKMPAQETLARVQELVSTVTSLRETLAGVSKAVGGMREEMAAGFSQVEVGSGSQAQGHKQGLEQVQQQLGQAMSGITAVSEALSKLDTDTVRPGLEGVSSKLQALEADALPAAVNKVLAQLRVLESGPLCAVRAQGLTAIDLIDSSSILTDRQGRALQEGIAGVARMLEQVLPAMAGGGAGAAAVAVGASPDHRPAVEVGSTPVDGAAAAGGSATAAATAAGAGAAFRTADRLVQLERTVAGFATSQAEHNKRQAANFAALTSMVTEMGLRVRALAERSRDLEGQVSEQLKGVQAAMGGVESSVAQMAVATAGGFSSSASVRSASLPNSPGEGRRSRAASGSLPAGVGGAGMGGSTGGAGAYTSASGDPALDPTALPFHVPFPGHGHSVHAASMFPLAYGGQGRPGTGTGTAAGSRRSSASGAAGGGSGGIAAGGGAGRGGHDRARVGSGSSSLTGGTESVQPFSVRDATGVGWDSPQLPLAPPRHGHGLGRGGTGTTPSSSSLRLPLGSSGAAAAAAHAGVAGGGGSPAEGGEARERERDGDGVDLATSRVLEGDEGQGEGQEQGPNDVAAAEDRQGEDAASAAGSTGAPGGASSLRRRNTGSRADELAEALVGGAGLATPAVAFSLFPTASQGKGRPAP